jgi:hypothetical protein
MLSGCDYTINPIPAPASDGVVYASLTMIFPAYVDLPVRAIRLESCLMFAAGAQFPRETCYHIKANGWYHAPVNPLSVEVEI